MLFVGSGFSQGQGGPSWERLRDLAVSELTGHLAKSGRERVWEQLTDRVVRVTGAREFDSGDNRKKPEFAMWVIGEAFGGSRQLAGFFKRHLLPRPSLLHAITVERVLKGDGVILTTEFDGLFEGAINGLCAKDGCVSEEIKSLTSRVAPTMAEPSRPVRVQKYCGKEVVMELHGSIRDANTLVCFPSQVVSWGNTEAAQRLIDLLSETRLAIFWGCGGKDRDIAELLGRIDASRRAFPRTLVVDLSEAESWALGDLRGIPLLKHLKFAACGGLSAGETWQLIDRFIEEEAL